MKDRTPTQVLANGAIRYGIYDSEGTLLRYEYTKPEDEPTQEGTPLNKATLLSDKTAEGLGLSGDPSVNDAINVARGNVGDIMLTTKSTLGEDWVLCNGMPVDAAEYPALAAMMPFKTVSDKWVQSATAPDCSSLETDGTIFAKVDTTGTIYYTTNPMGAWSTHVASEISAIGTFTTNDKVHIRYLNNQWVIWGDMSTSSGTSSHKWVIFYADQITGHYTLSTFSLASSTAMYDLMYGGGYYIASVSSTQTMRYATSLGGTWTSSNALTKGCTDGIYVDGMYIFRGGSGSEIYYSTAPAGTYTSVSTGLTNDIKSIQYENGLFVATSRRQLSYSTSVNGSWTQVSFDSSIIDYVYAVKHGDDRWVISGSDAVAVSETSAIDSTYTKVSTVGGSIIRKLPTSWLNSGNSCRHLGPEVPTVSIDGCNTFIRAKT